MSNENDSGFPQVHVPAIEDYGIIGDCRAAALVSRGGSIDWLCWPRFDRSSIFAALLDRDQGGHWSITPVVLDRIERQYLPDSNVLQTRFSSHAGTVVLTDLMPVATDPFRQSRLLPDHETIRRVECTSGEVPLISLSCRDPNMASSYTF